MSPAPRDPDDSGVFHRMETLEESLGKVHQKLGTLGIQMVELLGGTHDKGMAGRLRDDIDRIDDTLTVHMAEQRRIQREERERWEMGLLTHESEDKKGHEEHAVRILKNEQFQMKLMVLVSAAGVVGSAVASVVMKLLHF